MKYKLAGFVIQSNFVVEDDDGNIIGRGASQAVEVFNEEELLRTVAKLKTDLEEMNNIMPEGKS